MEGAQEKNNQYGISRTIQSSSPVEATLNNSDTRCSLGSENEDEPSKEVAFTFSLGCKLVCFDL
jgi:hypothetical protein